MVLKIYFYTEITTYGTGDALNRKFGRRNIFKHFDAQ